MNELVYISSIPQHSRSFVYHTNTLYATEMLLDPRVVILRRVVLISGFEAIPTKPNREVYFINSAMPAYFAENAASGL